MSRRVAAIAVLGLLATGCTGVTFVSPEYAARPVQPLNQQAALAEINAYRAANGLPAVVLDARHGWEGSSGHRENLLRPNVKAAGIDMSQSGDGRAYWTLVLGAER